MGGAVIDTGGKATLEKLFVAGEDSGGVHGANRLGGNGICDSCVFGRQAGKALAGYLANGNRAIRETRRGQVGGDDRSAERPLKRAERRRIPSTCASTLQELNWNKVGVARKEPDLSRALCRDRSPGRAGRDRMKVVGGAAYNMMYITAAGSAEHDRRFADGRCLGPRARGNPRRAFPAGFSRHSGTITGCSISTSAAARTDCPTWRRSLWSLSTSRSRNASQYRKEAVNES